MVGWYLIKNHIWFDNSHNDKSKRWYREGEKTYQWDVNMRTEKEEEQW